MNLSSKLKSTTTLGLGLGLSLLFCQPLDTVMANPLLRMPRVMNAPVYSSLRGQSKTLLPDGKLLLTGGEGSTGVVANVVIQDAQSGVTSSLPNGLLHARAWHTATLQPDGTILIFGGEDTGKELVPSAEIFDPVAGNSREVPVTGLAVRAHHTATLLTDGRVLFAGGIDGSGELSASLQTLDSRSGSVQSITPILIGPRRDHTATLMPNGGVLFWGGAAQTGLALEYGELYDPTTNSEEVVTNAEPLQDDKPAPFVKTTLPTDGATDVPLNALISVRFSKPLAVQSVTAATLSLSTNGTAVAAKVVPAEGGMLAFVSPATSLAPGTTYTVSISGAMDPSGAQANSSSISFTTVRSASSSAGTGEQDDERGPLDNAASRLPPLHAPPGETALAGQVLKLNGKPLPHVLLQIDNRWAYSDGTGRFLLRKLTPGHHAMVIDGATGNHDRLEYGIYDDGVDVKSGITNVLNYVIWMTPLDRQHEVVIPSPTKTEFIVTNPLLPGLELHLPPNTVIKDRNGRVVTRLSITPIPVSQPPFPLPQSVEVPIYFTIQPGGAYLDMPAGSWGRGAQLWYPNWHNSAPGTEFDFWNYDPEQKGWYVYGEGQVSKDRRSIIPNPGVEIYQFTGAMAESPNAAQSTYPLAGVQIHGGDPVDLTSGLFVYRKTDLVLPDVIPLQLERTYRPQDNQSRPFGIGTSDSFEIFMVGDTNPYTYFDLIMPDGARAHFYRTSSGTGYSDAVYAHTDTGSGWYGASIAWNPSAFPGASWVLTTKDQTQYYFPDGFGQTLPSKMALLGIRDRYGNTITIIRDSTGNVLQATSPNGRYITFQHDSSNRITQAQDNIGRTVLYQYDALGRLQQVTDAAAGLWQYTYDSNNNMLTIQDARGITYLTNQYDSSNRVIKQTMADGGVYQFNWTLTQNTVQAPHFVVTVGGLPPGGSAGAISAYRTCSGCYEGYLPLFQKVDVTNPNGDIKEVKFGLTGYPTSETYALNRPEQQTYTYAYYADNLIQSMTDQLGRITSYLYDANANLTSVTQMSGTQNAITTTLTYDNTFNQLLSLTDPLNNTTSFGYDSSGDLTTITDALQHQTTMTYDGQGRVVSSTDPIGNASVFGYFLADLASITDPLLRTTMRKTDAAGRVVSVTSSSGSTTSVVYSALNQVTSTTDALGNVTSFTYDPNGNLLTVTDSNQHTTSYSYDNMDRVQARTDPLQRQESYTYDLNGNLSTFTDRRGKVTSVSYDGLNRPTFIGFGAVGGNYESTMSYAYDGGNRLTQAADSIAGTIVRGYDSLDRLTSETTPQGSVSYTYDAIGRRSTMTVSGQPQVNYTYDNANRLTQISQASVNVQFGYDNANRRTSLTLPNGIVASYGYDAASQRTSLTYQLGTSTVGNLTYGYDLAGRRTQVGGTFAGTALPMGVSSASYDAANQLTNWNGISLSYDANGNTLSDGNHSYTWDARNRLSAIDSGSTGSFVYDAAGRRATKVISGVSTSFVYDGANPVQELSGTTPIANLLTGGLDEYFTRTDSTRTWNFLTDALGSTTALADSSGSVQTQYMFDPFGNTTATGIFNANGLAYTGRELDGTGLYYYRTRYYSPQLNRFISADPAGFGFGLNLYEYAYDSPTNYFDPSGEAPIDYILPGWLANHIPWNYVPAVCSADSFSFVGGGGGQENVFEAGAFSLTDVQYSNTSAEGWHIDGMNSSTLVEASGSENWGGGAVLSGRKPKEALVFVPLWEKKKGGQWGPIKAEAGLDLGLVLGYSDDGLSIGYYGEGLGELGISHYGGGGGQGGGWSLTFSRATSCVR